MGIALARDFVSQEYVGLGMIADLNVHRDIGADGEPKPHAHVMLTMRKAGQDGFGKKVRDWNRTQLLEQWRERWASHVNQRLRSEEHTSELQSLMRNSYDVFCFEKKKRHHKHISE